MERVWVYWNVRAKRWSVVGDDRRVKPADGVLLAGCRFKVNERGRQRVIATRRKNVHARIAGTRQDVPAGWVPPEGWRRVRVRYNPYEGPDFVREGDGAPVRTADAVWLDGDGRAWGLLPPAGGWPSWLATAG